MEQDPRAARREALVDAAERRIAEVGLSGLRARDLARDLGCALGALYSLVRDMDELVLRVGSRTLARLDAHLSAAGGETPAGSPQEATKRLAAIALAYGAFARDNLNLWRTLFEYRLAPDAEVPEWSAQEQLRLFRHVLGPLAGVAPNASQAELEMMSRTLFSAVHGVYVIGLDDKLVAVPRDALDSQVEGLVRLVCAGLAAPG
ncbi:TetR family transcriptional regulator [Alsobacter soli]|uniref:TetR family transcriptional regulator n=1 Tax=Alsobacter soli TaxID=2109933 RepID=A0A2T1HQ76_9HYPH|nr:TetR/AcrR family transcriptional regulator [Alsobacter soli]PSC03793.1 TetR family transcriptional regulator [Alsobacter soli]